MEIIKFISSKFRRKSQEPKGNGLYTRQEEIKETTRRLAKESLEGLETVTLGGKKIPVERLTGEEVQSIRDSKRRPGPFKWTAETVTYELNSYAAQVRRLEQESATGIYQPPQETIDDLFSPGKINLIIFPNGSFGVQDLEKNRVYPMPPGSDLDLALLEYLNGPGWYKRIICHQRLLPF